MTEPHPIRKLQQTIEAERTALEVTPEMKAYWRSSPVGKAFILDMHAELVDLYLEHTRNETLDLFTKGAIGILEDIIEWGLPDEEVEDGDIQG